VRTAALASSMLLASRDEGKEHKGLDSVSYLVKGALVSAGKQCYHHREPVFTSESLLSSQKSGLSWDKTVNLVCSIP
jgi:hypothetical protein